MINVIHVIFDLSTAGAQTVVMNYLRSMRNDDKYRLAVLLIGTPQNTNYEREASLLGIRLLYCNYVPYKRFRLIRPLFNWLKLQFLIYKVIRREKPDIVHTHCTHNISVYALPPLIARVPIRIHTLHSDPYAISLKNVMWAKFAFNFLHVYPICVTEKQAIKAVARYGINRYSIVKNGIDKKRFIQSLSMKQIRQEIGVDENVKLIGCIARFDKIKNHVFLVNVFAEYLKENACANLMLVGNGPEKKKIQELCENLGVLEKVIFVEETNCVEKYYFAMDVFMLTSFFESSSIVTVEAQFANKKCVISDRIPENVVITNNVNRISLDAPLKKWIDAIDGKIPCDKIVGKESDFLLSQSILDLKKIYTDLSK